MAKHVRNPGEKKCDVKAYEKRRVHVKRENVSLVTILGQDVNWSGIRSCLSEECSNLLTVNDLPDRVVSHPVADDNGGAVLQGPQG